MIKSLASVVVTSVAVVALCAAPAMAQSPEFAGLVRFASLIEQSHGCDAVIDGDSIVVNDRATKRTLCALHITNRNSVELRASGAPATGNVNIDRSVASGYLDHAAVGTLFESEDGSWVLIHHFDGAQISNGEFLQLFGRFTLAASVMHARLTSEITSEGW